MQVAAVEVSGTDVPLFVQYGEGRRSQVGGPADEIGHVIGDGIHHFAGRLPGRNGRDVIEKARQTAAPSGSQHAVQGILEAQGIGGEILPVAGKRNLPVFLLFSASFHGLGQVFPDLTRHRETLRVRPVELFPGQHHLIVAKGSAMDASGSGLVGAAIANDGSTNDMRLGRAVSARASIDGIGHGIQGRCHRCFR